MSLQIKVTARNPRKGSCITPAIAAELAALFSFEIIGSDATSRPKISADSNNIASLDSSGGILVPAASIYTEDQNWQAANPGDITFDGFAAQGIDAKSCFISVIPRWASNESGRSFVTASGSPDTKDSVMPSWRFKEITTSKVVIAVDGATQDATFTLQLLNLPIPPQQS